MFRYIRERFSSGDTVMQLLIINAFIFVLLQLFSLIGLADQSGTGIISGIPVDLTFAASSDFGAMLFRPWSLFTHMFTHLNFGHFLFNMIAMYTMGNVFTSVRGNKSLIAVYFLGGLCGYILFALAFNFIDAFSARHGSLVLGASAAVMAITTAAAVLDPRRTLFLFGVIKVELRWLALILVLLDLASVRTGANSGGHIGHLGGAIFGYIYSVQLQKGKDMGSWFTTLIDKIKSLFGPRRLKVVRNSARPKSDEQFNVEKKQRQKKIDEILDKISRSGYDSLSREEKDFLFQNAQK